MADLKEILYTKDKETINKTYKRIKKYAIREDVKIIDIAVMTKEAKISYLLEAFDNEKILSALMCDISLREFYDFDYLIDYKFSINHCGSQYWEDMGITYNYICDEESIFRFVDRFEQVFKKNRHDLYKTLGYRAAVNSCVCAMTNLYGIIAFDKAYEIFCMITQLGKYVSYRQFCEYAASFADMRDDFDIVVYMDNFVSSEYVKKATRNGVDRITPLPSYYELISKQGNKPFYTQFSAAVLFEYEYPESYGNNEYVNDFYCFLMDNFNKEKFEMLRDIDDICIACRNETGINEIFEMLNEKNLMSKSQKIQKGLVCHIMEIKNNIRLRSNRGFTINEMRNLSYDMDRACGGL